MVLEIRHCTYHTILRFKMQNQRMKVHEKRTKSQDGIKPDPALEATTLESPTFATNILSCTRTAVDAVEPASFCWPFSSLRYSVSVCLKASTAIKSGPCYEIHHLNSFLTSELLNILGILKFIPIANFVSLIKLGWLLRLLKRFFLRYSAVLNPPCPGIKHVKH